QNEEKHERDWVAARERLDRVAADAKAKGAEYDCIVPFSGGKDSTFTAWYICRELRLRPLIVRFDHGFLRQRVRSNTKRTLRKLGCDFLHFTPNWHVVKK